MPRIKLNFPDKNFDVSITIPVRITDINYGGHVGNDSLVSVIHEARMQFLQHHGYSEMDIEGTGLIMTDLAVEFKNESFYGDVLSIKMAAGDITGVSFELHYEFSTARAGKEVIIARAKTTMVCYNYAAKKVAPVPEKLKQLLLV